MNPLSSAPSPQVEAPKEILETIRVTKEELSQFEEEVDHQEYLKQELTKAKELIRKYLSDKQNPEEIGETEIVKVLVESCRNVGIKYKDQKKELYDLLGLKLNEEEKSFTRVDPDLILSSTDLLEALPESVVEPLPVTSDVLSVPVQNQGLDSRVTSLFREYSALQEVKSGTQVEKFLMQQWKEVVLPFIEQKYAPQKADVAKTPNEKLFPKDTTTLLDGIKGLTEFAPEQHSVLDIFKNALSAKDMQIENFFNKATGTLNAAELTKGVEAEVKAICEGITDENLTAYKEKTRPLDIFTKEEDKKTAKAEKEQKLTTVPENHKGWGFEKMYKSYIDATHSAGKRPKDFDEWMDERERPSGMMAQMMENIKLMFINTGLGKLFGDLIKDTWFAGFFGYGEEKEEEKTELTEEEKEKKAKEAEEKAQSQKEKQEQESKLKSLQNHSEWNNIEISDVKGNNFRETITSSEDIALLEKILEAQPQSVLGYARKQGLKYESLKQLDEMEQEQYVKYEQDLDGTEFISLPHSYTLGQKLSIHYDRTIKSEYEKFQAWKKSQGNETSSDGKGKEESEKTDEPKIEYATSDKETKEVARTKGLEKFVGPDNVKRLAPDVTFESLPKQLFKKGEKNVNNMRPVFKELFGVPEKFWKEKQEGNPYQLTNLDLQNLAKYAGTSVMDDGEGVWDIVRDGDDYVPNGSLKNDATNSAGMDLLEVNGTGWTWDAWRFEDIHTFFQWLNQKN